MSEQAVISKRVVETRVYERTAPIELNVSSGQMRAVATTISVRQVIGDVSPYQSQEPEVTLRMNRFRKDGKPSTHAVRRVKLRKNQQPGMFDEGTRARLLVLREQVLEEFAAINWDEVTA